MVQQRALAWQESAGEFERLGMPELGFALLERRVECCILLHLNDKSNLRRVAKVGNCKSADLLDKGLPSQLELVLALLNQVFDLVRLKLHDASDTQLRCPFALIQISQNILHVRVLLSIQAPVAITR